MKALPKTLEEWKGFEFDNIAELTVERGFIDHWLEATRDANPVYWNDDIADEVSGGIVAPAPMALTFGMSYRWTPKRPDEVWDMHKVEPPEIKTPVRMPAEAHFALKEFTGLKEGIVGGIESEFHAPLHLGDRLRVISRVTEIGEERTNRLGTGRPWTVEIEYRNQRDELVGIDRYKYFCYNRKA